MTTCAYCNQPATLTIIANPHKVCYTHALEFWTGLLGYTHGLADDPCVKGTTLCDCRACEEMGLARTRAFAIKSVGPSPGDHVGFGIRLAS